MKKQENWFKVLLEKRVYYKKNGQPIICPPICVTKFGELIKLYFKNRQVKKAHVKVMGESVSMLGYILRKIVVVKLGEEYFAADGQHLKSFLVSEDMPVEFILIDANEDRDLINIMRQMNSSSKAWGLPEFINVNTNDIKANAYNKLIKYCNEYYDKAGLTPKVMAAIMFNPTYFNEGAASKAIKNDYFVQNISTTLLKERLNSLKRFYRVTKMTPTNYLNAGLIILMINKKDIYKRNEKEFYKRVAKYVNETHRTEDRVGNKGNAISMLNRCWEKV
jgi:hypothetical protein